MGEKDLSLPPLTKTSKSQLSAKQPLTKQTGSYQKRYLTLKDKEATMRWQEGCFHNIRNTMPTGWETHKMKNNCIAEALPQHLEFQTPRQFPQPGSLALRKGASRAFGVGGQQGLSLGVPQDWGKQTPFLEGAHRFHGHQVPGQSRDSIRIQARPTSVSWRVSLGYRGQVCLTVGAGGGGLRE